jgi:hypothetical protein
MDFRSKHLVSKAETPSQLKKNLTDEPCLVEQERLQTEHVEHPANDLVRDENRVKATTTLSKSPHLA